MEEVEPGSREALRARVRKRRRPKGVRSERTEAIGEEIK